MIGQDAGELHLLDVRLWMDRRFIPISQISNAIHKRPPDVWKDNLDAV